MHRFPGNLLSEPVSNWAAPRQGDSDPWEALSSARDPPKQKKGGQGVQATWGTNEWSHNATSGWGASAGESNWGIPSSGWGQQDDEDDDEGPPNLWGAAGEQSWGEPAKSHWSNWKDEAKRNSKAFSNPGKQKHSQQQQNAQLQQLQTLLSHPAQHNPYLQQALNVQKQQDKATKKQKKQQKKEQDAHRRHQSDGNLWAAADYGWGPIPEVDEEEEDDRHVHFTPSKDATNLWAAEAARSDSYSMPSKTFTHATKGTTASLEAGPPYNMLTDVQFEESHGEALKSAHQALFGKSRFAKDRIYWIFRPDHDPRVIALLNWVQTVSYALGAFGLHKFLQSRERGALFTNVDYRSPKNPKQPCFDWLTFDELQPSMDKILQESVALYDPAVQVILFVFLPSKSGKSVAMWRRRITVPNNVRLTMQGEIRLCLNGLRRDKDYLVHVDELPEDHQHHQHHHKFEHPVAASPRRLRRSSLPPPSTVPVIDLWEKPKKRKWWHLFKVDW